MRKNIVAGNWKMNKTFPEGLELIQQILNQANALKDVELIVIHPFIITAEESVGD